MGLRRVGTHLVAEGADKYIQDTERANRSTDSFIKTLAGMGIVAGGLAALRALSDLGREAVQAVAAHEQLAMSMTSLVAKEMRAADETLSMTDAMGMASERAEELLSWIQQLAIKSPFSQEGVAQAFRTALAYNFTSSEAQRLTSAVIDFATATGQSVGVMNQVSLALGQIKAKGKLAGQEILQLVNAGFAVTPVLEKLGYTMNDVSSGVVSADKFITAFVETLENDFGGASERSAETINGLINSLGDLKQIGLRELFGPAIKAAVPLLSGFVAKIQSLMPAAAAAGKMLGQLVTVVIENRQAFMAGAIAVGVFFAVLNAGTIISAVTAGIGLLTTAVGGLVAALGVLVSPLGLLAIAAGTIVGGLFAMRKELGATAADTSSATGQISDDWDEMGDHIARRANRQAAESHSWGYNLVIQFANGMAKAISAVLQVLISIGDAIANWLSPGSPPKLLPDIDDWGTSAMDEFLAGFGAADFGVLKNMTGAIERFMRSGVGEVDGGVLEGIRGMRVAVAGAVEEFRTTGAVSIATLEQFDPAMRSYVQAMFQAEAANRAVADAQKALTAITKRYSDILKPLNAELNAIDKRRQEITDNQRRAELAAIVNDANAPALAREMALMELREIELRRQIGTIEEQQAAEEEAAQVALDAAQQAADDAQAELERQQALIDMRIEDNQLLQEMAGLLDDTALSAGGAAATLANMASALSGATSGAQGLGAAFGTAFEGIGEKAEGLLEDIKKPFEGIKETFDELKATWAETGLAFLDFISPVTTTLQEAWGEGGTWSGNIELMKIMFGQLATEFEDTTNAIEDDLRIATTYVQGQWGSGGTWEGNVDLLKTAVSLLREKWGEEFGENGLWREILSSATSFLRGEWGENGVWSQIIDDLSGDLNRLKTGALDIVRNGLDALNLAIGYVKAAWQELLDIFRQPFDISFPEIPIPGAGASSTGQYTRQVVGTNKTGKGGMDIATNTPPAYSRTNNYNNQPQLNFGGNIINTGMDFKSFETAVLRVVTEAIGA